MPEPDCSNTPPYVDDFSQQILRLKKLDEQAEDEGWDACERFSQKIALVVRMYSEAVGELPRPEPILTLEEEQAAMRQRWAGVKRMRKTARSYSGDYHDGCL
jgi:hypothetical protein